MISDALADHLALCATTVCRAWAVTRGDGAVLGFTDHDRPIEFEGINFFPDSGLSTSSLDQTTGLAVDNSEAIGILSNPAIREEDIRAGQYDCAKVQSWLVNWQNVDERRVLFRGSIGEIERQCGAFRAELRGLAEALSRSNGRVYQRSCGAILGDVACGVDMTDARFFLEAEIVAIDRGVRLTFSEHPEFDEGWFLRGRLEVLNGAGQSAVGIVKKDVLSGGQRIIEVWEYLSSGLGIGDLVRIEAGCDKRCNTCISKFSNLLNFQGFPDIPGEDWLVSYPTSNGVNDGGSLR